MTRRFLFTTCLVLALTAAALAGRVLPPDAKRGMLTGSDAHEVSIGWSTYRFAPGVRIYNESNHIIRPARLPERAQIAYELDSRGDVMRIWLLSSEESESLDRGGK
jgi:hypothetical protein